MHRRRLLQAATGALIGTAGSGMLGIARRGELGIDVELLSIHPFWYGLDRDDARRVVQFKNEQLGLLCTRYPDRPVDHVLETSGPSAVQKVAIPGGNAQRMFRIPA